ncbi:MAG: hypothetical protein FWF02_07305 [Micrococcales bacterium]|nr:hypothetical protein [Micrococcales bacterium]MCL2667499.1 hypothetical protein [Micrococcales bacterium]
MRRAGPRYVRPPGETTNDVRGPAVDDDSWDPAVENGPAVDNGWFTAVDDDGWRPAVDDEEGDVWRLADRGKDAAQNLAVEDPDEARKPVVDEGNVLNPAVEGENEPKFKTFREVVVPFVVGILIGLVIIWFWRR